MTYDEPFLLDIARVRQTEGQAYFFCHLSTLLSDGDVARVDAARERRQGENDDGGELGQFPLLL